MKSNINVCFKKVSLATIGVCVFCASTSVGAFFIQIKIIKTEDKIMTYYTLKCPHCKNVVNRATGRPSYIGNPFRKCPWCGGVYVDSFTQEWATKSPFQRKKFLIDKPLSGAFLSFIVIAGLLARVEVDFLIALIVGIFGAVLIFISWTSARKSSIQEMIDKSIERTKSAKYVELLKQAGFKIYSIQGIEIGGIHDKEDSPLQKEDIKTEKCFCCGNELKENEQTCSKCGAVVPVEIKPIIYERNRKILKWSVIVGLVVGFFTTMLFGSIDPNSYLFLIGILLGGGSAYLTSVCFGKYYNNQDVTDTKKHKIIMKEKNCNDLLKKCGKQFFVKYYYQLKKQNLIDIIDIIQENYSESSKKIRIINAKKIFSVNLQIEALNIIIKNEDDVANQIIIDKAKSILENETVEQTLQKAEQCVKQEEIKKQKNN